MLAFQWIYENYITDETCSVYRARGHDNGIDCSSSLMCKKCLPLEPCFIPDTYPEYHIDEFGPAVGEDAMMREIYYRGPIACGCAVTLELEDYKGGIFNDTTLNMDITHDVSVVGFGVENGVKYWVVRNSWGANWGENGFFRLVRGVNNLNIESNCSYAVPHPYPRTHYTTDKERNDPRNSFKNSNYSRPNSTNKVDAKFLNE